MICLKDKRSRIKGMYHRGKAKPALGQQGMASIVVVSVLIVILTLISIGFARLINRASQGAANRQYSASASYAAQSAVNDVSAYLKKYVNDTITSTGSYPSYLPKSSKCNGSGSLIGSNSAKGPFYDDSNLSGDKSTYYTCLLLDPTPTSLVYTQVPSFKSQVVKVNTSAAAGALDKLMISWQPSNSQVTGYPTSSSNLNDVTSWNSAGGVCKDASSANASCYPILRVSVYPISNGESLSSAQAQSRTVYLYPQKPSGIPAPIRNYTDTSGGANSFNDGSLIPIPCYKNVVNFVPATSDYNCNLVLASFAGAIAPGLTDSVYLRLTPIYNTADIKIRANDKFGDALNFIGDQAVVDATAQTGNVAKRLKAWVNISSLAANSIGISTNISPTSDSIPEQALRTAIALCKREILYDPGGTGFARYVGFDDTDAVCHDGNSVANNPIPTLAFSIIGNNGTDNGKRVCSTGDTPEQTAWGCSDNANPDSPSPPQPATVFVGTGDGTKPTAPAQVSLKWATQDASTCAASGSGWSGDKTGLMTFSGSPTVNGQGSDNSTVNYYSEYDLQCNRPGAPGPTALKKVYAWPYPTVWFSQTTVTAGGGYSLTWNVANSTNCTAGGDTGANGSWTGSLNSSKTLANFNKDLGTWAWNDTSSRTYSITCKDPIGRTASAQITLGKGQPNTCSGSSTSCSGGVGAPACSAPTAYVNPGANGKGSWFYQGNCPNAAPYSGGYHVNSNIPGLGNTDVPAGQAVPGWMGLIDNPGTYCIQLIEWVPGWTSVGSPSGDTGYNCWTIYTPMSLDFGSNNGIWDNGPTECSGLVFPNDVYNGLWYCRSGTFNSSTAPPRCADGVHRFTTCDMWWNVTGGSGNHTCTLQSQKGGYGVVHSGTETYWPGGHFGWIGSGNPSPFNLYCTDNVTGEFQSIIKDIP